MKKNITIVLLIFFYSAIYAQNNVILPGFQKSIFYDEQIKIFESPSWAPEVKFHINAPSPQTFDKSKKVMLIFFALPNGNSTDQTIGKVLLTGDDWHFDIQHIGAQTRFIRQQNPDYNVVVAYLEANQATVPKSWPTWRSYHPDMMIKTIIDSVRSIFKDYDTRVTISGHSGGGSFMFGFLNAYSIIPSFVERIAFLDATYNYDESTAKHGTKLSNWIKSSPNNFLSVLAYNDSIALYNGQPVVSATGGTWYLSKQMVKRLKDDFTFTESIDSIFWKYTAVNGRIKFILKTNPTRAILHTVQVEMNGFIQSILSGTQYEEKNYVYYTQGRVYTSLVQNGLTYGNPQIPSRSNGSKTGSEFMNYILNMTFAQREPLILAEFKKGNIPDFYRTFKEVQISYGGHICKFRVMPDYLAIGSNEDFCRIPMGPKTAQEIADYYGCTMPTSKMVDTTWKTATVKLEPVTHTPVGNANELVSMFITHNNEIEQQRLASGKQLGELVGGIKKDVVITNKLASEPTKVAIYGWHHLDGTYWQPLTTVHINTYVDYSHGVRLVNNLAYLDGSPKNIQEILKDASLYKILSDESGVMTQPYYIYQAAPPSGPKSFCIISLGNYQMKIKIKPDTSIKGYYLYVSTDGTNYDSIYQFSSNEYILSNINYSKQYYIKLRAYNESGISDFTEVLVCQPESKSNILLVQGFDRNTVGNTHDLIIYHAKALKAVGFSSATNDAVIDGLVSLTDYYMVDYVIGEESTADETFSNSEQSLVKAYLESGTKCLFVSGCELAWDLDAKGSATDKDFCYNYLKLKYINDAPLGKKDTYYGLQIYKPSPLFNLNEFSFDDGTHGTFNVSWPDAISPVNGSSIFLTYKNVDTTQGVAGIIYSGLFGNSSKTSTIICLGLPFETIYPEEARTQLMGRILNEFKFIIDGFKDQGKNSIKDFELYQNYPNPFNPSTTIGYYIPKNAFTSLKVYDILGKHVKTLINERQLAGKYFINFNGNNLSNGVYFYELLSDNKSIKKKMLLLK
jgi:hypothetical protein